MPTTTDAFTHRANCLSLEMARLNGALFASGDALVGPLGLTSARWQVIGAVAETRSGLPVANVARNMGLVRQSVQRIADKLAAEGVVGFAPNPHHRRAKLVQLTEKGVLATLVDGASEYVALPGGATCAAGPGSLKVAKSSRKARHCSRTPAPAGWR